MNQDSRFYSIFELIAHDVHHPSDPDLAPLASCGQSVVTFLETIRQYQMQTEISDCLGCLNNIIAFAAAQLPVVGSTNLRSWRRLHTDASILRSIADLRWETCRVSIATLDRAIIISGAADYVRIDLIHELIKYIQNQFFPTPHFDVPSLSPAIRFEHVPIKVAAGRIPTLLGPPSLSSFQSHQCRHPFILRNFAAGWPALNDHPWRSSQYLRYVAGSARLVPVEIGKDYRRDDWKQGFMEWDDLLCHLDWADQRRSIQSDDVFYMAQHNLFAQFPEMKADIIVPDYVYGDIDPAYFPEHCPPENPEQLVCNVWLGPGDTMSPAHTDPYYNVFVQAVGRKTVWISPPEIIDEMHPHSKMSNTSRVDVFGEEKTRGCSGFKDFWERVVPQALSETLDPGDLLYLPPRWWHAMRSESTSISVSMWF